MCEECYSGENRITPLLNPLDCLENHTQYICGTCGRCICIEHDPNRGLQRWNFPFKSLEIAKLYLRTADYTTKKSCGIYEIENSKGRVSYKIFVGNGNLHLYVIPKDVQDIPIEKADGRIIKVQGGGFQPFVLFRKKKSPDILTGKLFWILTLIFQEIRDVVFIAGNGMFFEVTDFSGFLKLF